MKIAAFFICSVVVVSARLQCQQRSSNVPGDWRDMQTTCIDKVRTQVSTEFKAAMQYMSMAAYFSKDSVNKLGFAKLFFNAASEERTHARKLISYLLMRGELISAVSTLIPRNLAPSTNTWNNGQAALSDALKLEAEVTMKIRDVMKTCENDSFNDYHLVDYLTTDFLDEQYKGQRELAGRVSTLDKMLDQHGELGEYLYDKSLLREEL